MAAGIAILDDMGITHWAPYTEKHGKANDSGRNIVREFQKTSRPQLLLACEGYKRLYPHANCVNQVKRVSTRVVSVTCITCMTRM